MAIWELGEIVAFLAWPLLVLFQRMGWQCQCDARRTWLNALGERIYAYWLPAWHVEALSSWIAMVRDQLEYGLLPAGEFTDTVSLNTAERWLGELVKAGEVAEITMDGRKLYGLPAAEVTDTVSLNDVSR